MVWELYLKVLIVIRRKQDDNLMCRGHPTLSCSQGKGGLGKLDFNMLNCLFPWEVPDNSMCSLHIEINMHTCSNEVWILDESEKNTCWPNKFLADSYLLCMATFMVFNVYQNRQ